MMTTKLHYGKLGGNVAYHGYQSFAEGEVTPEECHSIGMETAKRMWGDEYEIVVTTHLDKQHHLHNHFVVNSVSFKTGRKFENHISDHYKLRDVIFVDTMFLLIILVFQLLKEISDAMLLSPEMRQAAKDIKQFVADYHFLTDNQIHTTDDLLQRIEETKLKIIELEDTRNKADNKKRRANTPTEKEKYKALRKEITEEIMPLRKKLKQAEQILEKSPHLYELLQEEHRLETNRIRKPERTR